MLSRARCGIRPPQKRQPFRRSRHSTSNPNPNRYHNPNHNHNHNWKVAALHIECTEIKDDLSRAKVAHINALAEANLESTQRDKERARAEFIDIKLKSTGERAEVLQGEVETSHWEARQLQTELLAARDERDACKVQLLEAKAELSQEQRRYWKQLQAQKEQVPAQIRGSFRQLPTFISHANSTMVRSAGGRTRSSPSSTHCRATQV